MLALLVGGLVIAAPSLGHALETPDDRDKALPCRPTIACTADIVPPGTLEIEAGGVYRHANAAPSSRSTPFLLKLTAATWLQIQVGSNGYTVGERAGTATPARFFDSTSLGLKAHLLDQGDVRPSLAFSAALSVPSPAGQTGYLAVYDAAFIGYASKDIGPVHADLNVGLNLDRLEAHPLAQGWSALALSADLVAPFGVMAEGYAFSSATPLATRDGGFLFAFTHTPRRWLVFDLGGDIGFFPATRAYSAFVGVTVIPVVLFRKP